jgi:HlyD family secretion protein
VRRKWTCLIIVWPLLLGGCNRSQKNDNDSLFVSGRIDGDTVDISPKRDGKIVEIMVREGDSVQAGQVLARIVSPQDEAQVEAQRATVIQDKHILEQALSAVPAQVEQAEANLASSQAEVVRSQAELDQAKLDAERYPPLVKTGALAEQVSAQQQTKVKVAEASMDASHKQELAAEASLAQAQAQLQQIETARANLAESQAILQRFQANVSDLTITAPIAGTILTRSAEPGRVVASGQTILTMVDLHNLYLRGFIPEGNVGSVKVGQQAQVFLDSNPKEAIPAEVIRVDPQVMFTPENTYFKNDRVKQVMGVKLGLKGAYGLAKPGMPADGNIKVGRP